MGKEHVHLEASHQGIDNCKSEIGDRRNIRTKMFKILFDFVILMLNESSNIRVLIK